jgi:hypothetical protein
VPNIGGDGPSGHDPPPISAAKAAWHFEKPRILAILDKPTAQFGGAPGMEHQPQCGLGNKNVVDRFATLGATPLLYVRFECNYHPAPSS